MEQIIVFGPGSAGSWGGCLESNLSLLWMKEN